MTVSCQIAAMSAAGAIPAPRYVESDEQFGR